MTQVRVSDVSGEFIREGSGASIQITFHDDRSAPIELDVTNAELAELFADLRLGGVSKVVPKRPEPLVNHATEQYPRAYERWTASEDEQLEQLYRSGHDSKQISGVLQRQPSAVASRLRKLGLLE